MKFKSCVLSRSLEDLSRLKYVIHNIVQELRTESGLNNSFRFLYIDVTSTLVTRKLHHVISEFGIITGNESLHKNRS